MLVCHSTIVLVDTLLYLLRTHTTHFPSLYTSLFLLPTAHYPSPSTYLLVPVLVLYLVFEALYILITALSSCCILVRIGHG